MVYKLSRFGRNAADILSNVQIMQDNNVNLMCVGDGIDSTTDAGKLLLSVLSAVTEIERENIRAQTMAGRWQKAREGKWNGGQSPYGYRIEKGDLVVKEPEAELVRLIFDKFANTDMGYSGVASWLNANGHRKSVRRDDQSSRISAHFVKAILDNPVYIGKIAYGRVRSEKIKGKRNEYHRVRQDDYELFDGRHEALISNELWDAVRRKRAGTGVKTEKRYGFKHCHILSGLVMCRSAERPCAAGSTASRKRTVPANAMRAIGIISAGTRHLLPARNAGTGTTSARISWMPRCAPWSRRPCGTWTSPSASCPP